MLPSGETRARSETEHRRDRQIGKSFKDKHVGFLKVTHRFRVSFTLLSAPQRHAKYLLLLRLCVDGRAFALRRLASAEPLEAEQSSMCLRWCLRIQSTSFLSQIKVRQISSRLIKQNKTNRCGHFTLSGGACATRYRSSRFSFISRNYYMTVWHLRRKAEIRVPEKNSHQCKWQLMIL